VSVRGGRGRGRLGCLKGWRKRVNEGRWVEYVVFGFVCTSRWRRKTIKADD
jgi:hypothetical protein